MKTEECEALVIKTQPKREPRVQINVSKSVAEKIYGISESTRQGRREIADLLLNFALAHCEFEDYDGDDD